MGRSPIPLLKIVSRKKKIGLFTHHGKFERQVHIHRKRPAHKKNARSSTRTTSHKNDNKLCKFHPFHVKTATKRRKHFFDVRSYIYRRDSWANICQFTDFLILPVCVEPNIIIVTRKWCDTWLCTMSVDSMCARLVLVPPGSKAVAWKLVLSPQSAQRSRGNSLVVRLLHPVYL